MPTHNRAEVIKLTLAYLARQTLSADLFEVLVIDDGSNDDTASVVSQQIVPYRLTYVQQVNRGAAAARNLGVRRAKHDLIVFLDSDVLPESECLAEHLAAHSGERRLVVGRVRTWSSEDRPWFDHLIDPDAVAMDYGDTSRFMPFYAALAGNLSVKRDAFDKSGRFDEDFVGAGCEETEMAWRAAASGLPLWYNALAIGYHNHPRSLFDRCQQQRGHMRAMARLIRKHPELQTVIPGVDALMPLATAPVRPAILARRTRACVLGWAPTRSVLSYVLDALDSRQCLPRLTRAAYWRLAEAWRWVGFREGLRGTGR